jgi:hypothetical protein
MPSFSLSDRPQSVAVDVWSLDAPVNLDHCPVTGEPRVRGAALVIGLFCR